MNWLKILAQSAYFSFSHISHFLLIDSTQCLIEDIFFTDCDPSEDKTRTLVELWVEQKQRWIFFRFKSKMYVCIQFCFQLAFSSNGMF